MPTRANTTSRLGQVLAIIRADTGMTVATGQSMRCIVRWLCFSLVIVASAASCSADVAKGESVDCDHLGGYTASGDGVDPKSEQVACAQPGQACHYWEHSERGCNATCDESGYWKAGDCSDYW